MSSNPRRQRRSDPVAFRQSLLHLLEANSPKEEPLLAQLEGLREEGHPVYSSLLYILAHLSFSEAEARRHWRSITAHRASLRMVLGRDLGLRVAILDYFVNVNHALKNPKVIELSIYERTERSAVTDGLTGLYNHAYFLGALRRELQRARRHETRLALVMLDLDNFKKVNDSRGHLEGDKVLIKTAALVRESLREMDVAARYGGEEFAVILPDTLRAGGHVVAERIRRRVEERFRRRRGGTPITISGGVACFPEDAASVEELVQRADEGLYRSKADGKNRITLIDGERRRHLRVPVSARIVVNADERRVAARAKNVSESGLLLSVQEPMPIGSNVGLLVHPHGGERIGLRGEVVRVVANERDALFDLGVRLHGDQKGKLLLLARPGNA
ncbi:MAG: diguanylate cyclase [Vicinamibacteria bacterium]